jgi:cytochrome c-type biogenesis protein CcmH
MKLKQLAWIFLIIPMVCLAVQPLYSFHSIEQQQRFTTLIGELRCVVCQSQSLAESNAPLAHDIKQQIYLMVQDDKSEKMIKQYMVDRYGDAILYNPPMQLNTTILWGLPFVLIFTVLIALPVWVGKQKKMVREK